MDEREAAAQGLEAAYDAPRRRFIERATLTGLGISVVVHVVLLLIALVVRIDYSFGDAGGGDSLPVEFAVLPESALDEQTAIDVQEVRFEQIQTESLVDLDLLSDSGSNQSVSDLADELAPELEMGGGSISNVDVSTGSSGAGTGEGASFFGLEAAGKRFAYIVDHSGSMNGLLSSGEMTRWELTQVELIRSVHALTGGAEYSIVLYSTNAEPLFGSPAWVKATGANKASTGVAVMSESANGDTRPEEAFAMIYGLEPRADAIYFMTDGEFKAEVVGLISQLNRRRRIPVHCILFGEIGNPTAQQRVESMMRNIAKNTGGRYVHISDSGTNPGVSP